MVVLTLENLRKIMPHLPEGKAAEYLPYLVAACAEFEINEPLRLAAFLATVSVESADLTRLEENLNYRADRLLEVWPRRFNPTVAQAYAGKPEATASRVYASRMGNGDESTRDGWHYRGRGPLMLTGRNTYMRASVGIHERLVEFPDLLVEKEIMFRASAWFWKNEGLNALADRDDIVAISRKINGGLNGLRDRQAAYIRAKEALIALAFSDVK